MDDSRAHSPVPPGAVVVGWDGRPPADLALDWAAREASAGARRLVIVHVRAVRPAPVEARQRVVDRFPHLQVSELEVYGDPVSELGRLGRGAHLLVVGSRGRGASRNLPSSQVGTRAARHVVCPLVVVPHFRVGLVRRGVLVGVSVRQDTPEVLDLAFRHASLHGLPLTIVHADGGVLRGVGSDRARWVAEAVSGFADLHPDVRTDTAVLRGRPTRSLLRLAQSMNLLVVGQHASTGSAMPFGHVRSSIADRSPCPVAVVPQASARAMT